MAQVSKLPKNPRQAACCTSPLDEALDERLFKALGDKTRLQLLSCLARCGRACTTTEVAECCSVDFSVVTRHLALLADAGLLESRKEGRTVYYQVRYQEISEYLRTLASAIDDCCRPVKQKGGRCAC